MEGELVATTPICAEHAAATKALTRLLVVAVGNPVRLTRHSEPQPDFSILRPRDDYRKAAAG